MTRLGVYFTLDEMELSQTAARKGLSNTPDGAATEQLRYLVKNILDPLREQLGKPIVVSSGYRSPQLNELIGGAATSQHCLGQAADITVPGMSVSELAKTIRQSNLPFDQLINEFGEWVHVSYGPRHRRQAMIAYTAEGKTHYSPMGS